MSYICGQIKKGVTHVSDQPSKVDVQTETMEYKEMREADLKQEQYRSEIQEIKRKYDRKIEDLRIYMKRNKTIDQQELSERKQKIENEIREMEIETAERKYEFLKSREDRYRKYYHEAKKHDDREYWFKKKEVYEVRSELMRLQNKK